MRSDQRLLLIVLHKQSEHEAEQQHGNGEQQTEGEPDDRERDADGETDGHAGECAGNGDIAGRASLRKTSGSGEEQAKHEAALIADALQKHDGSHDAHHRIMTILREVHQPVEQQGEACSLQQWRQPSGTSQRHGTEHVGETLPYALERQTAVEERHEQGVDESGHHHLADNAASGTEETAIETALRKGEEADHLERQDELGLGGHVAQHQPDDTDENRGQQTDGMAEHIEALLHVAFEKLSDCLFLCIHSELLFIVLYLIHVSHSLKFLEFGSLDDSAGANV